MDDCEHNETNVTLLDLANDENDVDDETMSGNVPMLYVFETYIYIEDT